MESSQESIREVDATIHFVENFQGDVQTSFIELLDKLRSLRESSKNCTLDCAATVQKLKDELKEMEHVYKEKVSGLEMEAETQRRMEESFRAELRELDESHKSAQGRLKTEMEDMRDNYRLLDFSNQFLCQEKEELQTELQKASNERELFRGNYERCREEKRLIIAELNNRKEEEQGIEREDQKLINDLKREVNHFKTKNDEKSETVMRLGRQLQHYNMENSNLLERLQRMSKEHQERRNQNEHQLRQSQTLVENMSKEVKEMRLSHRVVTKWRNCLNKNKTLHKLPSLTAENVKLRAELQQFQTATRNALLGSAQKLSCDAVNIFHDAANRRLHLSEEMTAASRPCSDLPSASISSAARAGNTDTVGHTREHNQQKAAQQNEPQGAQNNKQKAAQDSNDDRKTVSYLQQQTREKLQQLKDQRFPPSAFDRLNSRSTRSDGSACSSRGDNARNTRKDDSACSCANKENSAPYICPLCDPVQNSSHRHTKVTKKSAIVHRPKPGPSRSRSVCMGGNKVRRSGDIHDIIIERHILDK